MEQPKYFVILKKKKKKVKMINTNTFLTHLFPESDLRCIRTRYRGKKTLRTNSPFYSLINLYIYYVTKIICYTSAETKSYVCTVPKN